MSVQSTACVALGLLLVSGFAALLIGAGPSWASPAAYPTPGTRSAVCDTSSAIIINHLPAFIGTAVKSPPFNPL